MNSTKKYKIALVHDDFIQFGGAEKLILDIYELFNSDNEFELKIFSSLISPKWKKIFLDKEIYFEESFLAKFPFCYKYSKLFFFMNLFPISFQSFNFDDYDIVFSSSTRFGHFVLTKPQTFHISYINSPSRVLWDSKNYLKRFTLINKLLFLGLTKKRVNDYFYQQSSDLIISNSRNIQKKVKKNYGISSVILYPFVGIPLDKINSKKENYFVLISRLVSWKRIDYVIKAFNELGLNLKIIGSGEDGENLKKISNSNIEFLGYVTDKEKYRILSNASALIFPQNEDFGLTLVESLLCGTPIIYFNKGGAKEILTQEYGVSYDEQSSTSLINSVLNFQTKSFNYEALQNHGQYFTSDSFKKFIIKLVKSQVEMKKS